MKSLIIFGVASSLSALGFAAYVSPVPKLVWNGSESVPLGLYIIEHGGLKKGDLVLAKLDAKAERLAVDRNYLPPDIPVLKHVFGMSGDVICRFETHIFVNGKRVSDAQRSDYYGRSLPEWEGCITLKNHQVFLMNDHPSSYDGRYFGPLDQSHILGRVFPLWTYEQDNE